MYKVFIWFRQYNNLHLSSSKTFNNDFDLDNFIRTCPKGLYVSIDNLEKGEIVKPIEIRTFLMLLDAKLIDLRYI